MPAAPGLSPPPNFLRLRAPMDLPVGPKLKAHVGLLEEAGQLKEAIDQNNLARVKTMMLKNPSFA